MPLSEEPKLALEVQQKPYRDIMDLVQLTLDEKIKPLEIMFSELFHPNPVIEKEII